MRLRFHNPSSIQQTTRMSSSHSLFFVSISVLLILSPHFTQAARRSRLDLTSTANTSNNNNNALEASSSSDINTNNNNDNNSEAALEDSLALPLKSDQSSSSPASEDLSKTKQFSASPVIDTDSKDDIQLSSDNDDSSNVDSASPAAVEPEKHLNDDDNLPKELKETPTASFEDAEIVESATQLGSHSPAASAGNDGFEECDSDMLGFEIVTG